MAMSIKGTQTEKNLLTAFAGESQARNRYTYYAGIAKRRGWYRSPIFSKRRPIRRKSTPNVSLNFLKVALLRSPQNFLRANSIPP